MADNPYAEDELKRRAQIAQLSSGAPDLMSADTGPGGITGRPPVAPVPVNHVMPVLDDSGSKAIYDITGGQNTGVIKPPTFNTQPIGGAPTYGVPERQTPSAGNRDKAAMPGWDAGNWADPNMHSVKYDAGDMLYGLTKPSEVGARVGSADFQKRFPGATFDGKDNIDFKGALSDGDSGSPVNLIDVLMSADGDADTSNGVWWGAPDGAPAATAPAVSAKPAVGGLNPAGDNSALTKILEELGATSNGEPSPAEREAILQLLQGGAI